ncbi:translation initiation factor IF-3 [Thermotoga sp. SG1]|uniref:translation initiation factor IF-3 n=1 Tax=Thermotoga sp. SG1 TaxID=126739 RepID=UPI001E4B5C67|nr:translation initiation factor IF-3 [Thermotoga sp. SG1]
MQVRVLHGPPEFFKSKWRPARLPTLEQKATRVNIPENISFKGKRAFCPLFFVKEEAIGIGANVDLPRNEQIKVPKVRVVDENGKQIGIMPTRKALDLAREKGLDLVLVAPNADPPVARIMDYGKYKYQLTKKQKENKKKAVQLKQMKFRLKIDEHDYQTKVRHIRRFLEEGHKVQVVVMFIGREMMFTDKGREILERVIKDTEDLAVVERPPKMEGRDMWMVLKPKNS